MFYEHEHFGTADYFKREDGKNFTFPLHLHNSFEFITVISGEMTVTVDDKIYELKSGESVFIFPNQIHSLNSRESTHMLCIFSPELIKAYYQKVSNKIPEDNKIKLNGFLQSEWESISNNSSVIEKKGLLYSLCAQFDKNAVYIERKKYCDNILQDIFEFVEQNYTKECSLTNLSAGTGYSYSYLSRCFKKITGISFNSYVNECRIRNACYLLDNTDYTVLQCALESGYESLRSFNRNFFALTDMTPSDYRQKK
jgi:AraC-like DNA-binding protein